MEINWKKPGKIEPMQPPHLSNNKQIDCILFLALDMHYKRYLLVFTFCSGAQAYGTCWADEKQPKHGA